MENYDVDLKKIFRTIWNTIKNRYLIIMVVTLTSLIGSIIYSNCKPKMYKSFSTLYSKPNLVYSGEDNYYSLLANSRQSKSFTEIVNSKRVLDKVISNLNLDKNKYNYEYLRSNLKINIKGESDVIVISYMDSDNERAFKIIDEVTKVSIEEANNIMNQKNIIIIDEPVISMIPECSKSKTVIIVSTLFGLIIGFGIGLFLDLLKKN